MTLWQQNGAGRDDRRRLASAGRCPARRGAVGLSRLHRGVTPARVWPYPQGAQPRRSTGHGATPPCPRAKVDPWVKPAWGTVTEETTETCIVTAGADTYRAMAQWLVLTGAHLTVLEPPELRTAFTDLAANIARIADDNPARERAI